MKKGNELCNIIAYAFITIGCYWCLSIALSQLNLSKTWELISTVSNIGISCLIGYVVYSLGEMKT